MRVFASPIRELKTRFPNLGVSSYQRASVWTPKQRAALIRSLLAEYPTGALILNRLDSGMRISGSSVVVRLRSSHDIIDGQQRLTTIYEFLEEPMVYFLTWAQNPPHDAPASENGLIHDVREEINALRRVLSPSKVGYVPRGTPTKDLKKKIGDQANAYLREFLSKGSVPDMRFFPLVQCLAKLHRAIAQKKLVIEEMTNIGTSEAESIYHLINTSGTQLAWWQLLWNKPDFVESEYVATSPYRTKRDTEVRTLSILYRGRSKLGVHAGATNDSFWHAMLALGEYVQFRLAVRDPSIQTELLPRDKRRLQVDGLGFRLVSAALSHDVGRAAVYDLFDEYSKDAVRATVDTLFDTADLLLKTPDASSPDYLFFKKYTLFSQDPVQAYPFLGLIVSAAKLVAKNKESGVGITLTAGDRRGLRALTEEIFREVVSTNKWAGTGDSRLKEWLDRHFRPAPRGVGVSAGDLGGVKSLVPTYKQSQWQKLLADLKPTGQRKVDRRTAALHFWVQYLFDSKVSGCLPHGEVEYDHIVPLDSSPRSLSTHPLNVAAISGHLNGEKGIKSYLKWSPSGVLDQEYRLSTLCDVPVKGISAAAAVDFLKFADHASLPKLIATRKKVFDFALGALVRDWISNGDK